MCEILANLGDYWLDQPLLPLFTVMLPLLAAMCVENGQKWLKLAQFGLFLGDFRLFSLKKVNILMKNVTFQLNFATFISKNRNFVTFWKIIKHFILVHFTEKCNFRRYYLA